jgi:phage-related protein
MNWSVEFVSAVAEAEVDALPSDMRTRFTRFGNLIQDRGIAAMRMPYARHLTGKLWELRLWGQDGIARSIYMAASGRRVIILRTFVKKTQETPMREIEIALMRLKEVRQ